jgi:hypothetical protein
MDTLDFIMRVEGDLDSLTIEEYVDGMAAMVASNIVFNLQGSWARAAWALIEGGIISRDGEVIEYPVPA